MSAVGFFCFELAVGRGDFSSIFVEDMGDVFTIVEVISNSRCTSFDMRVNGSLSFPGKVQV